MGRGGGGDSHLARELADSPGSVFRPGMAGDLGLTPILSPKPVPGTFSAPACLAALGTDPSLMVVAALDGDGRLAGWPLP